MTISRRGFLLVVGAGLRGVYGSSTSGSGWLHSNQQCTLIPRWSPPLALEMPISAATSWITPTECFYVFNHSGLFDVDGANWTVKVSGEVDRPLQLTMRDLGRFDQRDIINTLECAGNGRAFFEPKVRAAIQWERGAVGNGVFRGPRLADVLSKAKIRSQAKHIIFRGTDARHDPGIAFVRSIPIEKALGADTVLSTMMNGRPLSIVHGFPLRVIVPGWIGAASVKRLTEIRVSEHEAEGEYMQESYRMTAAPNSESPTGSRAITSLKIKSIISEPANGAYVPRQPVTIRGLAWAGEAQVAKVEVSTDSGLTWHMSHLHESRGKYAWRSWQYSWITSARGKQEIRVRASDTLGQSQPEAPVWNPRGYMWNGIDKIRITVEG